MSFVEKKMWIRCPECGRWISAEKKNWWGRIERTLGMNDDVSESLGELGDYIGMKPILKTIGKPFDWYNKILNTPFEALVGDNFKFSCPCGYELGTDDEGIDQSEGHELCEQIEKLLKKYKSIESMTKRDLEEYSSRIKTLLEKVKDYPYLRDFNSSLYDLYASVNYFGLHDSQKALKAIDKSIELWSDDPNSQALRGVFRTEIQRPIERYIKLQDIIQYKEAEGDSLFLSKNEFKTEFQEAAIKFADDFMKIPKERRKYLVVDDEFRYLPNSFLVLTSNEIASLESKGLTFPNGYPNEKVLYICHPYKTNEYLDAEDYKDELFYDQVGELIEILQCLGAKQIDITDLKTSETTEKRLRDYHAKIGGGVEGIRGEVEGQYSEDGANYEKSKDEFFHHHEFSLNKEPYIPSGTVWYDHMSDWQRKARMRLNGENRFKIRISSLKESLIRENEIIQLKADFEKLLAKGNIEGGRTLSLERKNSNIHEWEIDVEFYPLTEYKSVSLHNVEEKPDALIQQTISGYKRNNYLIFSLVALIIILIGIVVSLLF
jgi:hypothetical protein